MSITIKDIEAAIDEAAQKVKDFTGSRDELIRKVINPLQAKLREGVKAKLNCNEKTIRAKFRKLQHALSLFIR